MSAFTSQIQLLFAQEAGGGSIIAFLFPIVILGLIFYVLLILPQRRRHKKMEQMRSGITVGDEVRTIGGIIGRIVGEDGDVFTLDIGGQHMKIVKRAIAERVEDEE